MLILVNGLQNCGPLNLGVKKNLGFCEYSPVHHYIRDLNAGMPQHRFFYSRSLQTLRAYIFAAPWPTGPKIIFMKVLIYIYKDKKRKRGFEYF